MNTNIVPFGKYKGKDIEEFLADRNYIEWVLSQQGINKTQGYLQ